MTKVGLAPEGEGSFVVNARDIHWRDTGPLGVYCSFEGKHRFPQLGINVNVLQPGQRLGVYRRENAQEGFLVGAGTCLLIVEGEERQLRTWDFFHCAPRTEHVVVGAGGGRRCRRARSWPEGDRLPGGKGDVEALCLRRAGNLRAERGPRGSSESPLCLSRRLAARALRSAR